MAFPLVQAASKDPGGNAATITVTLAKAQNVGDLLVVCFGSGNNTGNTILTALHDTVGNTYTLVHGPDNAGGPVEEVWMFCAQNIKAAAAGANTLSVTLNASVSFPFMAVAEFAGIDTTGNALDIANANSASTGTAISATATTSNAHDLIVGFIMPDSGGENEGASFTLAIDLPNTACLLEYKVVTTAGSQTADGTGNNGPWVAQIGAFRFKAVSAVAPQPLSSNAPGTFGPYRNFRSPLPTPSPSTTTSTSVFGSSSANAYGQNSFTTTATVQLAGASSEEARDQDTWSSIAIVQLAGASSNEARGQESWTPSATVQFAGASSLEARGQDTWSSIATVQLAGASSNEAHGQVSLIPISVVQLAGASSLEARGHETWTAAATVDLAGSSGSGASGQNAWSTSILAQLFGASSNAAFGENVFTTSAHVVILSPGASSQEARGSNTFTRSSAPIPPKPPTKPTTAFSGGGGGGGVEWMPSYRDLIPKDLPPVFNPTFPKPRIPDPLVQPEKETDSPEVDYAILPVVIDLPVVRALVEGHLTQFVDSKAGPSVRIVDVYGRRYFYGHMHDVVGKDRYVKRGEIIGHVMPNARERAVPSLSAPVLKPVQPVHSVLAPEPAPLAAPATTTPAPATSPATSPTAPIAPPAPPAPMVPAPTPAPDPPFPWNTLLIVIGVLGVIGIVANTISRSSKPIPRRRRPTKRRRPRSR